MHELYVVLKAREIADSHRHPDGLGSGSQHLAVLQRAGERLFHQHRHAGLDALEGQVAVGVVRGGDHDAVYLGEDLRELRRHAQLGSVHPRQLARPFHDGIHERDELGLTVGVVADEEGAGIHMGGYEEETVGDDETQTDHGGTIGIHFDEAEEAAEDVESSIEDGLTPEEEAGEDEEEGGITEVLERTAEAVGDFIEDVVERIEDIFDDD